MSRFFVAPDAVGDSSIRITDREDLHHMMKVLRLKPGDEIDVSDGTAWEYRGVLRLVTAEAAEADIVDKQAFAREPLLSITLYQGMPKQGKMEMIIQKAVELGASRIVPVFTDRSVVTDNGKMDKKIQRWQKIADEAVKQCRRGKIPEIGQDRTFSQMAEELKDYDLVLFPYENEEDRSLKAGLRSLKEKPNNLAIIIGPEGGFSDREAALLKEKGAHCVTLGKTILRTETAGLATIAMVMYELEME
jgi:16S rRNA (uracil1498-N3)-methyltransferase